MMEIKALIASEDKLVYQKSIALLNSEDPFAQITPAFLEKVNAQVPEIATRIHRDYLLELTISLVG